MTAAAVVGCSGGDGDAGVDDAGGVDVAVVVVAAAVGTGVGVVGVEDAGGVEDAVAAAAVVIDDVVVVVVVENFRVADRSWCGARSVGGEWSKAAGSARRGGGDEIASAVSRGKAAIAVRAVVLSEVFVIANSLPRC